MPDPTPGQIAYCAFATARQLEHELALWALLPPYMREAWAAAAQAVLADGLGHLLAREAAALRQVGALVQAAATHGAGPELARAIAALQPWIDAQQARRA